MAKSTTKTTAKKAPAKRSTAATTRKAATTANDQTAEAKRTTSAQSAAAEKMFKDADEAALHGLPVDLTVEQREKQVSIAALGR